MVAIPSLINMVIIYFYSLAGAGKGRGMPMSNKPPVVKNEAGQGEQVMEAENVSNEQ